MPGFNTHYIFGTQAFKSIHSKKTRNNISSHSKVYALGLQGPDLFFYDLLGHLLKEVNLGELAHDTSCGKFLFYLRDSVRLFPDSEDKKIAQVYYLGFMAHHILDRTCHPFVYAFTDYDPDDKSYFDRHLKFETDIDTIFLYKYKKTHPSIFLQAETVRLSPEEISVVSTQLYYAYSMTYPDIEVSRSRMERAIKEFHFNLMGLHDKTGGKKRFLLTLEQFVPGHMLFSGIIGRDGFTYNTDACNLTHRIWKSPWQKDVQRTDSFVDLFENALEEYLSCVNITNALFAATEDSKERDDFEAKLSAKIGNISYCSGIEAK